MGDYKGFAREILGRWPLEASGSFIHDAAVRNGLIEETECDGEPVFCIKISDVIVPEKPHD